MRLLKIVIVFVVITLITALQPSPALAIETANPESIPKTAPQTLTNKPLYVENEVVIKYKPNQSPQELQASVSNQNNKSLFSRSIDRITGSSFSSTAENIYNTQINLENSLGIVERKDLSQAGLSQIKSSSTSTEQLVKSYQRLSNVEIVEPNYYFYATRIPNDPAYNNHDDPSLATQWYLRQQSFEQAWDKSIGTNVRIAILDTGVADGHHPALSELKHTDFGIQMLQGKDFINNTNYPADDNGHGTHVAGLAAAITNNNDGVASSGWESKIIPIKVLDKDGQGELSAIITGFNYAVSQGADIINMSLATYSNSAILHQAIQDATAGNPKLIIVAASGNDYQNGNPTAYPAAYNEVVAVGSVNKSNQHASYSNTGNHLELVTYGGDSIDGSYPNPSQWIYSSYYRIDWNENIVYIGEYLYAGTSQATPQVSGLIALMIAANPNLTAIEIRTILRQTATDLGDPGKDDIFGYGLINPAAALNTTNLSLTPTTQPSCGADLDCSGSVNIQDYQAWLNSSSGDLNGNGIIEITDLVNVLYNWIKI